MIDVKSYIKQIVEEAPTNSAGAGNVAGIGVGPDGEPPKKTKKKKKDEYNEDE